MDVNELTALLNCFPLSSACFSDYIRWLADHPTATIEEQENDLISALQKGDRDRLKRLESLLSRARETLALSETEFRNVFGFSNDLLTADPEKVHDVLAEPILVVNLSEHGFEKIRKLPKFIKQAGQRVAVADFVAERAGKKYAIELKTIRMENNPKPQPGKPMGNALIPYWWGEMFRNNIIYQDRRQGSEGSISANQHKEPLGVQLHNVGFVHKAIRPIHLDGHRGLRDGACHDQGPI